MTSEIRKPIVMHIITCLWYSYYNVRNLILICRHYGSKGVSAKTVSLKLIQSCLRTFLFEDKKITRLYMIYLGVLAGIRNESGPRGPLL